MLHLLRSPRMKKTLSILSLGAGMWVALSSCQQTSQNDYPGGYEEAMPMSEMAIADGELPPWLLEDNEDSEQIPAGEYTNHSVPIPDDEIKVADAPEGGAASQNQPELAQDDTIVDSDTTPVTTEEGATIIPSPVAAHTGERPKETAAAVTRPTSSTPRTNNKVSSGRSTADIKKLTAKEKKSIKRVKEPTLLTYRVRPGDNLSIIAKRSNTTVAQIRKDSGIKGDLIYPGQIIKVAFFPKGAKADFVAKTAKSTSYTVKRGDSISGIAAKNGVSTAALLKANNLTMKQAAKIQPGRKLTIPGKGGAETTAKPESKSTTHTVKRGESIARIASRYGLTTDEVLKANNLTAKQAAKIQPGRKLTIPVKNSGNKTVKNKGKKKRTRNRR